MYQVMLDYEERHSIRSPTGFTEKKNSIPALSERNQQQSEQLLRKRQADAARVASRGNEEEGDGTLSKQQKEVPRRKILVLTTSLGPIKIEMRPDLSKGSVEYIEDVVQSDKCDMCQFYRAEDPGILQGIVKQKAIPTNTVKGTCPRGAQDVPNECPSWDSQCGCHGPLMSRGAVAWAAGQAGGPDFFIDAYPKTARWWGTQHTNFGFISDADSMTLVDKILKLPTNNQNGFHRLKESVPFTLSFDG